MPDLTRGQPGVLGVPRVGIGVDVHPLTADRELYLAGLLLIPDEGSDQSIARSVIESFRSR